MKVYAEVYGCAANMADGEIALGLLKRSGHTIVKDPEEADAILLVTCTVKKPTSDRMLHRIRVLRRLGKRLIVAGCMASGEPDKVREAAPEAVLLHPRAITHVTEALEGRSIISEEPVVKLGLPRVRRNPIVSIIPVSEGCRWRGCSFCIVARTRGSFTSYPLQLILEEAKQGLKENVREIWLTSQDMGSYGIESGRSLLPSLIESVASLKGVFMVRVGMMNPIYLKPILRELAQSYLNPKVFKFLHLPVQSGSEKVLRDMRRGHTVKLFKEIVNYMRSKVPGLTLSTDLIVGYPTEDEDDFEETLKLVEEIKPEAVNISKFYARPGTPAEKLKPLDTKLIKNRSRILTELTRRVALEANERWIGWSGIALVDEVGGRGEAIARNQSYKPIILNEDGGKLLGRFVEVEILDAHPYCLIGRLKKVVKEPLTIEARSRLLL